MLAKDQLPEGGVATDPHSYLKVTMVYSDANSNKMAAGVCDSLKQKLGPAFHVEESSWKFELLKNEKLRGFAAEEAMHSDIVIVAAMEMRSVPEEIESWFQLWQDQRQGTPSALIALLDSRNTALPAENTLQSWLERKASEASMEFFCHVEMHQTVQINDEFEDFDAPMMLDEEMQTMDLHPKRFSI